MTFRSRLLVAFLVAVLVPMIALALFVRREMTNRITTQYERRVDTQIAVIEDDLAQARGEIATSIAALRETIVDDNRFRRAAVEGAQSERVYLLDYATGAMELAGLSMLQIHDAEGRIISSGHFRNEYDRLEPQLPRLLASTPDGTAVVQARAPDASFLALAGVDSFSLGGRRFMIVAGHRIERRFLRRLERENELTVELVYPGGVVAGSDSAATGAIARELSVPFVGAKREKIGVARFRVSHDVAGLHDLRRNVDRWFLVAVAATAFLAVVLVGWLASRISRPLVELAEKTSRIDLDRLNVDFDTSRNDEIGALSRLMDAMTQRLRSGAVRIKEAERRATLGEMARQVNHDIKNGLTPIRNVFRHLSQLGVEAPEQLPSVLAQRQGTMESSISYLENLASNYARLLPRSQRKPCDVGVIAAQVIGDLRGTGNADLVAERRGEAVVLGDPVSLRRVIENLVVNAIDSLGSARGRVTVTSGGATSNSGEQVIRIVVADTGAGMNKAERDRIFDDFYTTKETGTGLGLSIVRRLVMDIDGSIRVESEPGRGSRFIVDLPPAPAGADRKGA